MPVTTKMLAGATESVLFRPLGIVAYGFTPLLTTSEEIATAHGDDERVQEATVRRSAGVFYERGAGDRRGALSGPGSEAVEQVLALLGRERGEQRAQARQRLVGERLEVVAERLDLLPLALRLGLVRARCAAWTA